MLGLAGTLDPAGSLLPGQQHSGGFAGGSPVKQPSGGVAGGSL